MPIEISANATKKITLKLESSKSKNGENVSIEKHEPPLRKETLQPKRGIELRDKLRAKKGKFTLLDLI